MTARVHRARRARMSRGFSLIESLMAGVVMMIGLLGLASLQVVGVRATHLGKRMAQASMLAADLEANMQMWQYGDARLAPQQFTTPLTSTTNASITQFANTGKAADPSPKFDYSEGSSATGAVAVSQLATNYQGVQSPTDGGVPLFTRYWNVFPMDFAGTGTAQGKLIQICVRWKEPGFGYRQVNTTFYKYDQTALYQ